MKFSFTKFKFRIFMCTLLSLFVIFFNACSAARILGYIPTPSYSHQVAIHPIWTELSLRGHQITVITTDPISNSTLTNLTEINVHEISYKIWNRNLKGVFEKDPGNIYSLITLITKTNMEVIDKQLGDPKVQKLIHDDTQHFDLLIVEYYFPAILAFAERFKCPYIGVSSFEGIGVIYQKIGSPAHPVTNPDILQPYNKILTFSERIFSVISSLGASYNFYSVSLTTEATVKKHFGPNYSDMNKLAEDMSMLFINCDPIFCRTRPLSPNVIQFGGGSHLKPVQPLPEDLKKFLDSANDGFIYFSLGSNIKSKDLPPKIFQVLLKTFSKLSYKVLWKFELNQFNDFPKNVKVTKWIPQQDVLSKYSFIPINFRTRNSGHPNIKLFITQGGLQSIEETLHSHVPIVGLPFFADQPANVKHAVEIGIGLSLNPHSLSINEFKHTILEVINNPKYKNKAKELSNLIHDQPMSGLERAIWWTEYVIRHKGASHFRSPVLDIPFYQYYLLDIIGLFLISLTVLIYVTFKVLKLLCRLCKYLFLQKVNKIKSL